MANKPQFCHLHSLMSLSFSPKDVLLHSAPLMYPFTTFLFTLKSFPFKSGPIHLFFFFMHSDWSGKCSLICISFLSYCGPLMTYHLTHRAAIPHLLFHHQTWCSVSVQELCCLRYPSLASLNLFLTSSLGLSYHFPLLCFAWASACLLCGSFSPFLTHAAKASSSWEMPVEYFLGF